MPHAASVPPSWRREYQPGDAELDHQNGECHGPMHPFGQPLRVPCRPRRKRLGPEVIVERGQMAPRRITARELRGPRQYHESEQLPPYEPASERERRALGREARYDLRGREQEREQPGLEEERIPLEPQECLSRHREREVADP